MGQITLEYNALNKHYLPKMCIELPLPVLDFEKIFYGRKIKKMKFPVPYLLTELSNKNAGPEQAVSFIPK